MTTETTNPADVKMSEAEVEHLELFDVSQTARTIARSALRVASSDVRSAFVKIGDGDTDEAFQIMGEAVDQLQYAMNMLRGRVWELRV